ncbi:MAG: pyridoxal phosphate-dependent aminotransferase [Flavobacteriaceae bacterium]|jgi:aspartate aminotransferase
MPQLSKKGLELPASPIRKLVVHADAAKERGIEVLHLNIGQPDIEAPQEAMQAVLEAKLKLLPYGMSQGTLSYRTKLCNYYKKHQIDVSPEDILVTTGASEALYFCLNLICNAGDQIIIPEPFYANYNGFASAASVDVVPVVSDFADQYELPPIEKIAEKITPKTKAILLCNPSNPTGYVYGQEAIEALGKLVIEKDIFLIVDEVYREFIHNGTTHYSVLCNPLWSEHSVMIDSVSKRYSMCGARVGCMVSRNKKLLAQALKFAQLRLSPPAYALIASEAALDAPDSYLEGVIAEYGNRRKVMIEALEKIPGVAVSHPMGAFYCMAKLPVDDAEDFSKFLLTDFSDHGETLMLAPGQGFYSTPGLGKNEVRIAFVLEAKKLIRAAEILALALQQYKQV